MALDEKVTGTVASVGDYISGVRFRIARECHDDIQRAADIVCTRIWTILEMRNAGADMERTALYIAKVHDL